MRLGFSSFYSIQYSFPRRRNLQCFRHSSYCSVHQVLLLLLLSFLYHILHYWTRRSQLYHWRQQPDIWDQIPAHKYLKRQNKDYNCLCECKNSQWYLIFRQKSDVTKLLIANWKITAIVRQNVKGLFKTKYFFLLVLLKFSLMHFCPHVKKGSSGIMDTKLKLILKHFMLWVILISIKLVTWVSDIGCSIRIVPWSPDTLWVSQFLTVCHPVPITVHLTQTSIPILKSDKYLISWWLFNT